MSYLEILITLAIVATVLFVAHRSGQANPTGTGRLSRRLSALETIVAGQGDKIESLDNAIVQLVENGVKTTELLQVVRIELASDRVSTERTWNAVDRLQNYFIESSFKRRDAEEKN